MTEEELLSQLKDIVEPAPVGWWPPAPGWWILALLVLLAIAGTIAWMIRRRRANRFRVQASQELALIRSRFERNQDAQDYLGELNALLKRVAVTRYGRDSVAPLHGRAWCQFLGERAPGMNFSEAPASLLGEGHYRPLHDIPADAIADVVDQWIRRCR